MKIKKLIIYGFLCIILFVFGLKYCPKNQQNYLEPILTVNGDEVYPKFSKDVKDYYPISLSVITPNLIKFGDTTKKFNVKEINPKSPVIPFKIGNKTYNLHIWSDNLSEFETEGAKNVEDGMYFITSKWWNSNHNFPAYIVDKYGKILYYRYARNENGDLKHTSDFKFIDLKNGETLYALFEKGTLLILNKLLQPINRIKLIESSNHSDTSLDPHHSIIYDADHVLLFTHAIKEVILAESPIPRLIAFPYIQEIQNGRITFEWDSFLYPELYPKTYETCPKWSGMICDYYHLNTLLVDNKDDNLILSFRSADRVIKINKKTGQIMWQLSGKDDYFHLSEEQKFYGQHFPVFNNMKELIVFDNHNNFGKDKKFTNENSSIKIYTLDEQQFLLKDFRKIPLSFSAYGMGNAYPLENGNFVVSSGGIGNNNFLCATELSNKGNILWQLKFKNVLKSPNCYYIYKK